MKDYIALLEAVESWKVDAALLGAKTLAEKGSVSEAALDLALSEPSQSC